MIVRHHLERHRSSNSGRLAHLALPSSSQIIDHGGAGGLAQLPPLDGAWLLYPLGAITYGCPNPAPQQIVVLDATWSQARRMYRKLAPLRGLPVLHLPDTPMVTARLRESPGPGRVSAIEAIARALRIVDEPAAAAALERLFDLAVARAQAQGRRIGGLSGLGSP